MRRTESADDSWSVCEHCNGMGSFAGKRCEKCGGSGQLLRITGDKPRRRLDRPRAGRPKRSCRLVINLLRSFQSGAIGPMPDDAGRDSVLQTKL